MRPMRMHHVGVVLPTVEQAERLMAPYLVDGGFSFQGVAG